MQQFNTDFRIIPYRDTDPNEYLQGAYDEETDTIEVYLIGCIDFLTFEVLSEIASMEYILHHYFQLFVLWIDSVITHEYLHRVFPELTESQIQVTDDLLLREAS